MAQRLVQTQMQKLSQQQRLSQQQMLQVRLLEMPLTELEESVNAELDDNPAMESSEPDDALSDTREEQDEKKRNAKNASRPWMMLCRVSVGMTKCLSRQRLTMIRMLITKRLSTETLLLSMIN